MKKRLEHDSVIPLYHQLKEIIQEHIAAGHWKPGDLIPSENKLREEYNISRNTIKKAIEDLVQEGVLHRRQGKGTFVSTPKVEHSLSAFYSFTNLMKARGIEPKDRILSVEVNDPKPSIASRLHLNEDESVLELRRIRYADDEPMILESSYIPYKFIPGFLDKNLEGGLYELLQNDYNIYVSKAKEIFEPVLIRDYESKLLEVEEGRPALLLERIAHDTTGQPVEYCRAIVRGDRCRFYTELLWESHE